MTTRPFLSKRYFRTNPIWSLTETARILWERVPHEISYLDAEQQLANVVHSMQERGIQLPAAPLEKMREEAILPEDFVVGQCEPTPGVVGIIVDRVGPRGFTVPLRVTRSKIWRVSPFLPFNSTDVQHLLTRLLGLSHIPMGGIIPERFAFSIEEELHEHADGSSMTVAALLAIMRAVQGQNRNLLSCVCSLVQPARADRLAPVDGIGTKIHVFLREYGRGSLLVRHADCAESARYDTRFDTVWCVRDLQDLAHYLERTLLFTPLLERVELTRHELTNVVERLRVLEETQHDYQAALDLAMRIESCELADEVPIWERTVSATKIANLCRHLGRFQEAYQRSRHIKTQLEQSGDATCHDQVALATVDLAASLFDKHAFAQCCEELEPWRSRIDRDGRCLHPDTRIRILNTLARAQIAVTREGWEDNLHASLSIQKRCDRANIARTRNYLILGYLRIGRIAEARKAIEQNEQLDAIDSFSYWMLCFAKAELARRTGRPWQDDRMERDAEEVSNPVHPFAFYYQATARQTGRPDAVVRFRKAAGLFLRSRPGGSAVTVLAFFACCMELAVAAYAGDTHLWRESRAAFLRYLDAPHFDQARKYYEGVANILGATPDLSAADALLEIMPFI